MPNHDMGRNSRTANTLHHLRRQSAFTLLEVMICLVILAIAIPAFLAAIVQNVQLEAMNAETNVALAATQRVIEDVHALGFEQINSSSVPSAFSATGLTSDGKTLILTNSFDSALVGHTVITTTANTKAVLVTVSWRGITGGDRQVRLLTEVTSY